MTTKDLQQPSSVESKNISVVSLAVQDEETEKKPQDTPLEKAQEQANPFSGMLFDAEDVLMLYNMAKVAMKPPGNFQPSWKYAAAFRRVRETLRRIKLLPS